MATKRTSKPKCVVCVEQGMSPSDATVCMFHSVLMIRELQAEISVLKDTASASSKLHLAIANLYGGVPSTDGSEELEYVEEIRARIDRVTELLAHAANVAGYEDSIESQPPRRRK